MAIHLPRGLKLPGRFGARRDEPEPQEPDEGNLGDAAAPNSGDNLAAEVAPQTGNNGAAGTTSGDKRSLVAKAARGKTRAGGRSGARRKAASMAGKLLRRRGGTPPTAPNSGQKLVVFELDGDGFTATVAQVSRAGFRVLECHREEPDVTDAATDSSESSRKPALTPTEWLFQRGHIDLPLHVLLPDDVAHRLEASFPRQKASELHAAQARAARKGASLCDEIWHGARRIGPGETKGSSRYALLATPRGGLLDDLNDNPDLQLMSAMQREQALLSTLPDDRPERILVVDGSPTRLRLLLLEGDLISESLRLSSADHDALRDELSPALRALTEAEGEAPEATLFSPSLCLGGEVADFLSGSLPCLGVDPGFTSGLPGWESGEAEGRFTTPGLASLGALKHLCRDAGLTAIRFDTGGRKLPSPRLLALAGGGLALAIGLPMFLGADEPPPAGMGQQAAAGVKVAHALEQPPSSPPTQDTTALAEAPDTPPAGGAPGDPTDSATSEAAADTPSHPPGLRMPASLALAEACNQVTDGILLDAIRASRDDGLRIEGKVAARSRLAGLQALAAYRAALLDLPFVDSMVESLEYHDLESGAEELSFRLDASWSVPDQ